LEWSKIKQDTNPLAVQADLAGPCGDEFEDLMWAAQEALEDLLATAPTTLPGVVALFRYLGEPDVGHDPDYTLLAAVLSEGGTFDVQDLSSKLPGILADVISKNIGA
jgi:hypothetical protein